MDLDQQRSVGILVFLAGGVAGGIVSVVRWWLHGKHDETSNGLRLAPPI
jgi:hypothetical protein